MSFYNRALKLNQFSRFLHTVPSNLPASSSRSTSGILASRLREPLGVIPQQRRLALCSTIGSNGCVFHYGQRCSYSTEAPDELPPRGRGRTLPKLMDFPEIIWPSIMKSIKNWIMVHFIIRPYFDREFSLPEFVQGAKQALQVSFHLNISKYIDLRSDAISGRISIPCGRWTEIPGRSCRSTDIKRFEEYHRKDVRCATVWPDGAEGRHLFFVPVSGS